MNSDKSLYGMDVPEDELLIKTRWSEPLISPLAKGIPILEAAKELFIRSLPLVVTYLAVFSIKNAAMHYLRDQPDVTMISAVGIAFTLINIFATAVYISLNVGLMIKATDAYMAETYQNVGLLLHRGLIINLFVSIPGFIALCFSDYLCLLMGFDAQLSYHVQYFIYLCLPGVFLLMIFTTLTSYINACNKFSAPQLIQILTAIIFWAIAYVFAEILDWGLQGIALSYNIMYLLAVIGLVLYLKIQDPAPGTLFWIRSESCEGIGKLFVHQIKIGWTVYVEFIVFELVFLLCAALNTTEIIGYTIAYNNLPILYILPTAFSDTMLTHIVGSIQERDISKAQKFLKAGFGLNLIAMIIVLGLYLGFNEEIAALYVTDDATLAMAAKALRLYSIIIIPDFIHMGLQSALKAIGKERTATLLRNLCYYAIAVPLAYFLCYIVHLDILGLILGPVTAVTLMTIICIVIFWKTKWTDVIQIAVGEKLFDETRSVTEIDEREAYQKSVCVAL